jgi:putative ABC transport system permease protein
MQWTESIRIAVQSLWANKLRTVLTLLGMMIGVAAVITVITLVNGANHYVATKLSGHGADVITVQRMPGVIFNYEDYIRYNKRKNLTWEDYQALMDRCRSCVATGAQIESSGQVTYGDKSSTTTAIRGWTPSRI